MTFPVVAHVIVGGGAGQSGWGCGEAASVVPGLFAIAQDPRLR
jgi:hypothetical protein